MSTSAISEPSSSATLAASLNKTFYQADQQVKFMHLQAEVDCLLQELQHLKIQRQASGKDD
ncbi:MAG: hypothetical protein IGS39_24360 [Calothrix sp. C42_A2020_038]|nr:hypothetical protein [Calothrix sp. C42_A2020_038]